MGKEEFSLLREMNTPGIADKEGRIQGLLQLFDGLTDGGLTDKEIVGSLGNISCQGCGVKDAVEGQVLVHGQGSGFYEIYVGGTMYYKVKLW